MARPMVKAMPGQVRSGQVRSGQAGAVLRNTTIVRIISLSILKAAKEGQNRGVVTPDLGPLSIASNQALSVRVAAFEIRLKLATVMDSRAKPDYHQRDGEHDHQNQGQV